MASEPSSGERARVGQFVDPKVLGRISNLSLLARTVVQGFISGLHRSTYLGRSADFAEHRPYMPGDDIRQIDWRLFARTDRFYVKEFEADTNTSFTVLLDVSRSMNFGTEGITKLDYARYPRSFSRCVLSETARPHRARDVRRGHRRVRAPFGEAPRDRAPHAR